MEKISVTQEGTLILAQGDGTTGFAIAYDPAAGGILALKDLKEPHPSDDVKGHEDFEDQPPFLLIEFSNSRAVHSWIQVLSRLKARMDQNLTSDQEPTEISPSQDS